MPLPLPGLRVECDQRLGKQVVARAGAAVIQVARIPGGQIDQPVLLVDGDARPGFDLPRLAPRLVLPGRRADVGRRLRNRRPPPDEFSGAGVIRTDVAGRRLPVDDVVADGAPEDDQVFVDGRCGVDLEMRRLDRPAQILAGVDHAVETEAGDRLPRFGIEAEQAITARQKDAQLVAVLRIPPCRHPAMPESAGQERHPDFVGARVVDPLHRAGFGIERCDAVVVRRHVDDVVDHDRRRGEVARHRAELLQRPFLRTPSPRDLQPVDIGGRHVFERRVARVLLIGADVAPLDGTVGAGRRSGARRRRGDHRRRSERHRFARAAGGLARGRAGWRTQAPQVLLDGADVGIADVRGREAVHHRAGAGPYDPKEILGAAGERHQRGRQPTLSLVAVTGGT